MCRHLTLDGVQNLSLAPFLQSNEGQGPIQKNFIATTNVSRSLFRLYPFFSNKLNAIKNVESSGIIRVESTNLGPSL